MTIYLFGISKEDLFKKNLNKLFLIAYIMFIVCFCGELIGF